MRCCASGDISYDSQGLFNVAESIRFPVAEGLGVSEFVPSQDYQGVSETSQQPEISRTSDKIISNF